MKNSYKRLSILLFCLFIILFLNSFVSNILSNYHMVIFLIILIVIFKFLLGFEKDRHRYIKDILMNIILFAMIYFILYYLLGIIIGFARTENYYSVIGLKEHIIPIICTTILTEVLRYMMVTKAEENKILLGLVCLFFIGLNITNPLYYQTLKTSYDVFMFIALILLPAISRNIACTYVSLKVGYKPLILYSLIFNLYPYLLPVVPNPSKYLISIVDLLTPLFMMFSVYRFFKKEKDEIPERDNNKNELTLLIPALLFMSIMVYLTSGYFHFYGIAIASGSMSPNINKGDVVIVEKTKNYSELKVGQVIAYKYDSVVVVHRLEKIIVDKGTYYFYTKGDANPTPDMYSISENMIIGVVNVKIPLVGMPTVWLNEL